MLLSFAKLYSDECGMTRYHLYQPELNCTSSSISNYTHFNSNGQFHHATNYSTSACLTNYAFIITAKYS